MKRLSTLIVGVFMLFSVGSNAQSFTIADTVRSTPIGNATVLDVITAGSSSVEIGWKVSASDFPADWLPLFSLCDNTTCISNGPPTANTLWPTGTSHVSMPYPASAVGDFHMIVDLTTATTNGTHYLTVRLNNNAVPTDTALTTFVITHGSTTGVQYMPKSPDDVILYPNPSHDEVNVIYNASADIKSIAVYNIIGKVMAVYKVTENNNANLNIENIPSGIYFVRLMNSNGSVVLTRKFTKQ